ncbi:MAG: class II aldolase/adducin family protein [Candidatus Methylacidiphilales bacterium]
MKTEWLHPRALLVQTMDRIYHYRMTTTSGGNLSVLDEEGNLWITPSRVDKGGLVEQDVVRIRTDGTAEGLHPPSSEYPFHRQIYAARPDLRAIIHAHPVALVAFSVVRQVPDVRCFSKALGRCSHLALAPYALPGSEELGGNIARVFSDGADVAILENHGVVVGGRDMDEAFARFELLEFFCRSLIQAGRIGKVNQLTDADVKALHARPERLPEFETPGHHLPNTREKELRGELARFIRRGYRQGLFTSVQGTFSARVDHSSFVITPKQADRRDVTAEDFCLVRDGRVQPGREASLAARLHHAIYHHHPEINTIVNAAPPSALAFAMTDATLDSRTIPESYLFLREVPRWSFRDVYEDFESLAPRLTMDHPVSLVSHDGVLVLASSIFEAFDRLEVTEATAQSLIESSALGPVVPMDQTAISDLRVAFGIGSA